MHLIMQVAVGVALGMIMRDVVVMALSRDAHPRFGGGKYDS